MHTGTGYHAGTRCREHDRGRAAAYPVRMRSTTSRAGLFALMIGLALPVAVRAEWYWFKDSEQDSVETARIIRQPAHAQRFFGRLESKKDADFYTMTVEQDTPISVVLAVPAADGTFRPTLTIFGPGLPKPKEDPVIPIGDGNGAFIASDPKKDRETAFDGYLLTSFFDGIRIEFNAPKTATYALAVRSPDGTRGRYVLRVGTKDEWKWSEIPDRIYGIVRAALRLY